MGKKGIDVAAPGCLNSSLLLNCTSGETLQEPLLKSLHLRLSQTSLSISPSLSLSISLCLSLYISLSLSISLRLYRSLSLSLFISLCLPKCGGFLSVVTVINHV